MPAYLSREATLRRLRRGDALRMELGASGARQWWFEEPHALVSPAIVQALTDGPRPAVRLVEALDSLFALPLNSQTYLAARGGRH
jgi:hypothetical protein